MILGPSASVATGSHLKAECAKIAHRHLLAIFNQRIIGYRGFAILIIKKPFAGDFGSQGNRAS